MPLQTERLVELYLEVVDTWTGGLEKNVCSIKIAGAPECLMPFSVLV
jgi:hypothetical protein